MSIGSPGSSFAVEVATRIGLPKDIIVESSAKLGEDFINMDNFLQSIARDKIFWEDKRKEIQSNVHTAVVNQTPQSPKAKAEIVVEELSLKDMPIEKGDSVRLTGQTAVGDVLEMQGKQVTVAFGQIKSTVSLERLELVKKRVV